SSAVPKYREDGAYSGYVGASTDITDRKKAEESIHENEAALQESYREIQRLAGSLITAQDSERARISRDLHDDVSQQLAALSISLSTLKRRIGLFSGDTDLQQTVSLIQQRTVALAESVRNLSHDLHPDVLKHAGLTGTLEARCAEISRDRNIAVNWSAEGDVDVLDANTSFCLYRIAQESLHNVVKHADARIASVVLRCVNGSAELTIADDGKGFDIAEMRRRTSGLGLLSISERVRLAQGTLSVVTEVGKGTQIRVRLPLHRQP